MGKNGLLTVLLFLFMIGLDRSNALNSRKLVATKDPNGSSNANQDSPLSSPPPDVKKQNASAAGATEPKNTPNKNPSDDESKGMHDVNTKTSSENSSDKKLDKGKSHDGKEKVENQTRLKPFDSKSCMGNPICSDQEKTMIACIQDVESGSNKLTLLVHNERDTTLKVNITLGTSMNNYLPAFEIPGLGTEKVNITFSGDKSTNVILNAGNGNCELQISRPKTMPVDVPSKSKDSDNTSKPKDVNDPADSPAKPKDVKNSADSPVKPKEIDEPAKAKKADSPVKPKEDEDATKLKDVDNHAKSPKDIDNSAKSKDKDVEDAAKAKDKDIDNSPKSKGMGPPPKLESVDVPPMTTGVDSPISESSLLDQLSFYSKQVTPIYGAYFAFLVALVIGGSWAMCSFRKRKRDGGVAYQELEMGLPESSNAVDVETAEGWDQDWDDDDWDEDKAIRSPGGGIQTRTISSNGLTSRSSKKDGWDADWDN